MIQSLSQLDATYGVDVARTMVTNMACQVVYTPREQRVDWFWACRSWAGEPRICEPGKASHLEWFPLDSLPSPIPDYERLVLEGLRDGDLTPDTAVGFGG